MDAGSRIVSEDKSKKTINPVASARRAIEARVARTTGTARPADSPAKSDAARTSESARPGSTGSSTSAETSSRAPASRGGSAAQETSSSRPWRLDPDRFQKSADLEEEEVKDKDREQDPDEESGEEPTSAKTSQKEGGNFTAALLRTLLGRDPAAEETGRPAPPADQQELEKPAQPVKDPAPPTGSTGAAPADSAAPSGPSSEAGKPEETLPCMETSSTQELLEALQDESEPAPQARPEHAPQEEPTREPSKPEGVLGTLGRILGLGGDPAEPKPASTPAPPAPEEAPQPEGVLGTLGRVLGLGGDPSEPKSASTPAPPAAEEPSQPEGVLGTLVKVFGLAPREAPAPTPTPTPTPASQEASGPLSGLLGKIFGKDASGSAPEEPATSTTSAGKTSGPLLKSVIGEVLGVFSPIAGALATAAAGAAGSAASTDGTAAPTQPNPPIGALPGVADLPVAEHQKVAEWYEGLSPQDRQWYEGYVASQPPEKQTEALSYARRIQDQYISDPQERVQMRQGVLDEYLSLGLDEQARRSMGTIVLTDTSPENKRRALEEHGFLAPSKDGSPPSNLDEILAAPATYATQNNNVLFSTDLLSEDRGERYLSDVVAHEESHRTADTTQTGGLFADRDNQLFFALEKERAFKMKTASPEALARNQSDLAGLYREANPGVSPSDATAWAQNALSNSEEYYASMGALQKMTREDAGLARRVESFDPDLATLVRHAEAGTLPSDKKFLQSMSAEDLSVRYGVDRARLGDFEGHQEDAGKRSALERYLLESVGLAWLGTNPTGSQNYGGTTQPEPPTQVTSPTGGVQPVSSTTPATTPTTAPVTPPVSSKPSTSAPSTTPTTSTPPSTSTPSAPRSSSGGGGLWSTVSSWLSQVATGFSSLGTAALSMAEIQQILPPGLDLAGVDLQTLDLDGDGQVTRSDLNRLAHMASNPGQASDSQAGTPLSRLLLQLGGHQTRPGALASVFEGVAARRLGAPGAVPSPTGGAAPTATLPPVGSSTPPAPPSAGSTPAPGSAQPAPAPVDPGMTALRVGIFREASAHLEGVASGQVRPGGLWALNSLGQEGEGLWGMTDAFETLVTGKGGPEKMMGVFRHAASSPDQALAMSSLLKGMVEVAPDRAVGTLLLTMDAPGGSESVGRLFSAMSREPAGAINLAQLLQTAATNPSSARGLWEMMDTLTTPTLEDAGGGTRIAAALGRSSDWVQGSQALTRTFSALLQTEGGGIRFANLVHRMSDSHQGAADTARLLQNMAFDKQGGREVARMLAQGTQSRSGARAVAESLNQMAATREGGLGVGRLFMGVSGSKEGARLLANLSRDSSSAGPMLSLLNRLEANPPAAARFSRALDQLTRDPRLRPEMAIFRGRVAANPELESALQRVWTPQAQPAARASAPLPLTWGGALAMEQAGMGSRHAGPSAPSASTSVSATPSLGVGAPVPASPEGASSGQHQGQDGSPQGEQRPMKATLAAPPEVATAARDQGPARTEAPARIGWPALGEAGLPAALPAPAGEASTPVQAAAALVQADLRPGTGEKAPAQAVPPGAPGQEEGESASAVRRPGQVRPALALADGNPVAHSARASLETTQAARASGEAVDSPKGTATPFRPGDYYSEDTLRSLRLCPECGFRTSAGGICARCVASAFREGRITQAVVGVHW